MGSILIPYNTLKDASKLTSIRNLIEYFLNRNNPTPNINESNCSAFSLSNSASNSFNQANTNELNEDLRIIKASSSGSTSSIVSIKIGAESIRLANKSVSVLKLNEIVCKNKLNKSGSIIDDSQTNESFYENTSESLVKLINDESETGETSSVSYAKSEIAFCGKIKENKQFFALVILSTPSKDNRSQPDEDNLNLALFDSKVSKASSVSSSCLVFRYLNSINSKSNTIEALLNEISYLYRHQDCVFIRTHHKSNSDQQIIDGASPKSASNRSIPFSPGSNSNEAYQLYSNKKSLGNFIRPEVDNVINNLNYEILPAEDTNEAHKPIKRMNSNYLSINDGAILIKKTNDIYFNNNKENYELVKSSSSSNDCKLDMIELNAKAIENNYEDVGKTNGSSSKKSGKLKDKLITTPKSKSKAKNKMGKLGLVDIKKQQTKSNKKLKLNKNGNDEEDEEEDDEEGATGAENEQAAITNNNNNNQIKLIKENIANLFLSKKSHHPNNNNNNNNDSNDTSSNYETNSSNTGSSNQPQINNNNLLLDDSELLRTIEYETNKNAQLQQQESHKLQMTVSLHSNASSNSETTGGANKAATITQTTSSKFSLNSLNNRLSMKFSSASSSTTSSSSASNSIKLKKSSQAFQFLRSKPPIHSTNEPNRTSPNPRQSKCDGEFFADANQFLNAIELQQQAESSAIKPTNSATSSSSRLSYPFSHFQNSNGNEEASAAASTANNQTTTTKSTAKRLLFGLIGGSHANDSNKHLLKLQQQHQQQQHNFQQRRLSDYHRPTKVGAVYIILVVYFDFRIFLFLYFLVFGCE